MLSICIPVYNNDVTILVKSLQEQIVNIPYNIEIILIDDASDLHYRSINKGLVTKYVQLDENVGRAKIRNLFLNYSDYPYLLFLDCDSFIISNKFIENYINILLNNNGLNVLCGGRIYKNIKPKRKYRLRWKYGLKIETKSAEQRREFPNKSFLTNNFVIRKELFSAIKFDESIITYGHEDTLFGYRLQQANIKIEHVDNPILNNDYELNREFLRKTNQAVINLVHILQNLNYDVCFIENVKMLKFYYRIKKNFLFPIIKFICLLSNRILQFLFNNGLTFNLHLFNFYKLGVFIKNISR